MQEILDYLVCVCWLDLVGWTGGETSWLVSTWAMCGLGSFSVHLGIAEALVGERFGGFWVLTQNYLLKHINLQHSYFRRVLSCFREFWFVWSFGLYRVLVWGVLVWMEFCGWGRGLPPRFGGISWTRFQWYFRSGGKLLSIYRGK